MVQIYWLVSFFRSLRDVDFQAKFLRFDISAKPYHVSSDSALGSFGLGSEFRDL